ncbi:MAG: MBL fold metallo-hydrolase [Methanomassiliicoccales archaeon]|nr:MAG: MBL fold metallo-hydrolase [Methanomassiliicoccales archaeon]
MAKPKKIWENVYQIGGSNISHTSDCCIYLVGIGGNEGVMIDCGAGQSANKLVANMKSVGVDPQQLKALILTHCHIDHIGAANLFKERYNCRLIAHINDQDAIEGKDITKTAAQWYGVDYSPAKIDHILAGDFEKLSIGNVKFNCIHTPGHTPGSISVFCDIIDKRVLFGQDVHGPFDESFGSNISDWRASMQKLLDLEADILCEGHFGIYRPKEEVKKYIEGYLRRF